MSFTNGACIAAVDSARAAERPAAGPGFETAAMCASTERSAASRWSAVRCSLKVIW